MEYIFTVNREINGIARSALAAYSTRKHAEDAAQRLARGGDRFVVIEIPYYESHKNGPELHAAVG